MPESVRFERNSQDIAADIVEGEAIIINLANGNYYSLDPVGSVVWELIDTPQPVDTIAAAIAARFDAPPARVRSDAEAFLAELLREQLVVEVLGGETPHAVATGQGPAADYAPPRLTKYTDMADMLALDPPLPGVRDLPWKTPAAD